MAEEALGIELQVQNAMRSRVSYFKEQSDSLTFEGVRRLLEEDLGLEKYALDVHKRFIKERLVECIGGGDDDNAPKNSGESESVGKSREETAESGLQLKKDVEDEKMEDSPVLGLMTGNKASKNEKETQSIASEVPSEDAIKKAVIAKASYARANSDKVTMVGIRRLLEKDLGLDEFTLDPYKKLISVQLDEALNSIEVSIEEKKKVKKGSRTKASVEGSSDENSDASGSESEEIKEVKPRKKVIRKEKLKKSEPIKRKRPVKEAKVSSTKPAKLAKQISEEKSASEGSDNNEDNNSQSSAEKPVKKKEVVTPAYGKRVEHLKSVIKSCGMGVPPVIYKKIKQVSENKREASLIKELEEILSKEGLSANPSEKEIKEVRKRKERARELEGIDTSNIVSSSRRRSTTSFTAPPPKPKVPVESDHSGSSNDDEEEEDSDDGDDEDNEDEGDEENGDSQSEELDPDNDEDSD